MSKSDETIEHIGSAKTEIHRIQKQAEKLRDALNRLEKRAACMESQSTKYREMNNQLDEEITLLFDASSAIGKEEASLTTKLAAQKRLNDELDRAKKVNLIHVSTQTSAASCIFGELMFAMLLIHRRKTSKLYMYRRFGFAAHTAD